MKTFDQTEKLKEVIAAYSDVEGALVQVLQKAQEIYGFLPSEAERLIADGLGISLARVVGVRSFYAYFYNGAAGKNIIRLCKSSPCHVNNSSATLSAFENALGIKAGETTADNKFHLETCGCLGICDKSPAVTINGNVFGPIYPEDVASVLEQYGFGGVEHG